MKNKKSLLLLGGFFLAIILVIFFVPHLVSAASNADNNYGLDATADAAGLPQTKDLATVLGNVIGSALSFISVLFFGLMLYGGFTWMTARGKSESTQKALDTIIAAVIGIVIVLAAYAITNFVFSNVISGAGGAPVQDQTPSGASTIWCPAVDKCIDSGSQHCLTGTDYTSKIDCENSNNFTACNNDGKVDVGEACDNGGGSEDGCSSSCVVVSGWDCDSSQPGEGSLCVQ